MTVSAETDAHAIDLRALDLFGRLVTYPGNARFRERLLRRETEAVLHRLAQIEAGHLARAAMPTEMPDRDALGLVSPPGRIGPFRLTERIGQGGMGDVWRAERDDGLFEQVVAIKLIQANLDARAAAAFEAERRILARLDHPDIVRLIDGGVTEDGLAWLIMDHVEGVPFDAAIVPLALEQRVGLFVQAARAVAFAHGRLVAHADLKPSNILVDAEGRVRLLDFGISELLSTDPERSAARGAMTIAFASPQRVAGATPSIADDVYALGRLLEMVVGDRRDFDLGAIIAKASAADERFRYAAVASLISDLEYWQRGMPVSACPDTLRYRARKFVGRNRALVIAATLAVLALLTTTAYATIASIRADRARAEANARYEDAHGIAHYLIFDVMQRLENQPHSLRLRIDVARTAQSYLDRLARLSGADAETRLDTAKGLLQLAAYQGRPGVPNLDQPAAARANLGAAEALLQQVHGPEAEAVLAHVLLDRESIAANTDSDLPIADALLARARPVVARAAQYEPLLLPLYQRHLANLSGWRGRYADEVAASRRGLDLLTASSTKQSIMTRDVLLDTQGEGLYYLRRRIEALADYRAEMTLDEDAYRRWPTDHVIASRLNIVRVDVGSTLNALGRFDEALPVLIEASREARREAYFEPADRWAEGVWQSADVTRAQTLASLGRIDQALAIDNYWDSRLLGEWKAQPDDVRRMRYYIEVMGMTGEAQALGGRFADQCRTDRLTLATIATMKAMGRLTRSDDEGNFADIRKRVARKCR